MIVYKDLIQCSPEWFEMKWGKIGGSLSKSLFVKSDTLLIDIASQLSEEFEPTDSFENEHMLRGTELEPFAVEYLEEYLGLKFQSVGWMQCENNELLGISPDGITEDLKQSCEIKCLGRKAHFKVITENILPLEYAPQCIHYFTVNPELEKHHFLAFRPEAIKHFQITLTRDSIVNIGTKANPVMMPIKDASNIARKEADLLLAEIKKTIEKLNF